MIESRFAERLATWLFAGMLAVISTVNAGAADTPITPGAAPEAQSLLAYCSDIYGKNILSGQQVGEPGTNALNPELVKIQAVSGKLPAVLGLDFIFCTRNAPNRDREHRAVKAALDWATNRNGIVTFCWHWFAPMGKQAFYTKDTIFNLARAVTEGTPEYNAMLRDLDSVAEELKILRDARVPVLWRPMHEVNGRWFWWGNAGPESYKKLWRLMFERFTNQHKLNNLIWVFSPGCGTDLADWYPGDAYVDMIGQDYYPMDDNDGPVKDVFDELVALGRGTKLVGMSENGPIPDPDRLVSEKANWLFFVTWAGSMLTDKNPDAKIARVFNHPHVLNLSDLPKIKDYPFTPAGQAVKLAFNAAPGDVAVGGVRRLPVTVAVQDERGRTVRNGSYSVTLALETGPAGGKLGGKLGGNLTAPTINGVATFPDLTFDQPGQCVLQATASELRPATSASFKVGPGAGVVVEEWLNVVEVGDNGFTEPAVAPTGQRRLTGALEVPARSVTNYTARFRGELLPPLAGSYQFWIASLTRCELWLGTDSTPGSMVKIASVDKETPYCKWPHMNEAPSSAIKLEAGRRYYLEVRQAQKSGSAQLAVRWRLPNGAEERPIPGFRVVPLETGVSLPKTAQNR